MTCQHCKRTLKGNIPNLPLLEKLEQIAAILTDESRRRDEP